MKKQELNRSLQKASEVQAFITATQFAKVMGVKTADYVKKKYLSGLECVGGKYYFISDVTAQLMKDRNISS